MGSHSTLLRFDNLCEWLTELKETCTYIYWFIITSITNDADGKPGEEIQRVRSRTFFNMKLASQPVCMFTSLEAL